MHRSGIVTRKISETKKKGDTPRNWNRLESLCFAPGRFDHYPPNPHRPRHRLLLLSCAIDNICCILTRFKVKNTGRINHDACGLDFFFDGMNGFCLIGTAGGGGRSPFTRFRVRMQKLNTL